MPGKLWIAPKFRRRSESKRLQRQREQLMLSQAPKQTSNSSLGAKIKNFMTRKGRKKSNLSQESNDKSCNGVLDASKQRTSMSFLKKNSSSSASKQQQTPSKQNHDKKEGVTKEKDQLMQNSTGYGFQLNKTKIQDGPSLLTTQHRHQRDTISTLHDSNISDQSVCRSKLTKGILQTLAYRPFSLKEKMIRWVSTLDLDQEARMSPPIGYKQHQQRETDNIQVDQGRQNVAPKNQTPNFPEKTTAQTKSSMNVMNTRYRASLRRKTVV